MRFRTAVKHKRFQLKSGEYVNYVDIKGDGRIVGANSDQEAPVLLLTHGFGSGCGLFFSNYDAFASQFHRVVSVDWIGMGISSRPSDAPRLPSCGPAAPTSEASDFFIDALEVVLYVCATRWNMSDKAFGL